MPIKTALMGVVPPVLIALVVLLAAWRPWSKTAPKAKWGAVASALALALAYAVTETLVAGHWPGMPPSERHRWLPYAGLLAALGVVVGRLTKLGSYANLGVMLCVFGFLRWNQLSSSSTALYGALWVALAMGLAGGMVADTERVGKCGPRFALTWGVSAVGAAVAYAQASEIFFAQMAGTLAAVMGVFAVVAFWRPTFELIPGAAAVFAVLYMSLALCIGTTVESKALVMLAGLAPAFAGTPLGSKLRPWVTTVLCMLIAAGLGVAAVWQSPGGFDFSPN